MKKIETQTGATLCSSMRPRSATTSWLNKFKLLALVLTTMLSVNVWGSVKEINGADISGFGSGTNYTSGSYDAGDGFTIASSSGFSTTQFRVAKSNSLTITSESGTMTKIVITVSGTGYKLNDSKLSYNSTTGTYTISGGADEVVFNNSSTNIARITKIEITYGSSCAAPTSPTNGATTKNSQVVSWTSSASAWDVYHSTSNTTPTTQTTETNLSSKSYTFTELTPATKYYWWVRANCGSSTSSWVAGTSFTTSSITYTDYLTDCGPTMYDVKFYTDNGSTQHGETQSVEEGHSPVAPANPTPASGYAFAGWSLEWGGTVVDVSSYTINEATNFYAKWEKKKPTQITLTSSNGYDLIVGDVTTISVSEWLPADLLEEQKGITYSFKDDMSGKATIDPSTGVVTTIGVCENCTIVGTSTVDSNIKGEFVIHINAPNYFANNKTIFIMGGSYGNAWDSEACVKAWYSNSGGGGAAPNPTWIYDNTYKIFALVMPAIGDYNQIQLQRFPKNCEGGMWNVNGTVYKSGQGDKNVIISNHSGTDAVAWHSDILHIYLRGSLGTDWNENLGELTDQGAGIFQYTYTNYVSDGTEPEFKWADSFGGWQSGDNVKVTGMVNGSTYNLIATLDVTQDGGAFTITKELVACKVHFDMQGHGSAIASLTGVTPNSKIAEPTTPTAENYRFDGWYKEASCTNAWNFATDEVQETMTLYAKWTRVYTYTFSGEGACANGVAGAGERVNLCADPVITGKSFTGWIVSGGVVVSGSANNYYFTMPSNDVTITAGLSWKTTAITLDKNNTAGGNTDGSATATYGTGLSNYVAATRAETSTYKYVLTGYYTNKTSGGEKVIDEEGHLVAGTTYTDGSGNWIGEVSELTLYARWDNYCQVTWVNNGGTVATTYIKQNETVGENMQADLESSAACSSTYNNFVGWYTEASGTETSPAPAAPATKVTASTQVTAKTTYYAVWSNASGGGGATDDISVDFTTFASYPTGFPTATGTSSGTYTFRGYSFDISAPTEFYRNGADGSCYLFLKGMTGENVSTISLPARSGYKLTKVTLTIPSGAGTTVGAKIDGVTGGDQWTFVAGDSHDFELSGTSENTSYTLTFVKVSGSGAKNAQVGALTLQYTAATVAQYISSCCSSDVNIAITSEPASPLALGLDGHATSTVSFAKTATNTIWMYQPTISPSGATFSGWSGEYKTANYNLTFDATAAGTYTISEEALDKTLTCSKVFNAEIVVAANPIIAAMKDEAAISALTVNGVCAGEGDANSFVIKSRYLTNAQVTVTASTTTGSGAYKVSKDGTNYSNSVNFTGGQDALGEQTIYVRYETSSESETGTLAGNIAITSAGAPTQNVTLSGTCTCSPRVTATMSNNNIVAVNGSWSAGLSEVDLSAYNLTMGVDGGVTIKFESTNDNFKLKENITSGAGVVAANLSFAVTSGSDAWNQNIVVTYNPTTAGATETATITVKVIRTNGTTEYARTQFTVKGYSLPAEFVMATKVDGNWYTMTEVAAASGNTPSPGTQLVVDNITTPTIITGVAEGYLPSITVFTPATRPTVNTNAECVRFESKKKPGNFLRVPDDDTYLYFNSENSTSNSYWRMTPNPSVEGEFYIALPNNAHGRSLSAKDAATGKTTFGHFKQTTSWRLLPLSPEVHLCTRYIAPNVQVTKLTNGSNDVTLKVSSTNGEPETLGYEYSTDQTSWTAMSGTGTSATVTLTGLTKGTDYTYYVRGIVTDGTENCSGEKEVTFTPFNPIVTVTPSSLDLTCLAGETDTKTLTITPNDDAAGWTIGANPITGANASMFSFNAGTSEVTFSPAVGTADGNYTATLTIKSQAGNVSANVTLTGTVVSKAAMAFGIEDLNGGMICEKQLSYSATGIYVYLNNGRAVYSAGDRTTKANAPGQISNAVFIRDLSTGGADVQTGFSYGVDAGVAHFIIKQANLVYGHTYRISYYNDLANGGNGLFNAEGLGFADGYVDFVYSADCSKPTAILPCITSPTTAVANWEYAACAGNATVEVYTKTSNVVHDKSLKEACNNWGYAKRNKAAWGLVGSSNSGSYPAATWGWTLYQGGKTYVYSPEMSEISSSITSSTVVTVTVTMKNNRDYACTMDVYPVICASNPTNTNPTFTQKTAYFDQSTTKDIGSYSVPANANGETIEFTISGLESNYSLCFASRASQIALFVQNVKFEIKGKNSFKTLTPSCSAEEVEITGLSANTKYYYTVTNGGNTSNEVEFTTWTSGAGSVQFYNNEACTSQYEIASSDNILVLGGEQTTVYLKGTKVAGCEPVVSVSAGYRIEDHSTYNPSTGALGGYVVLTLADPTQTAGTLTVTDGAGGTTVRNIISSTCPAGMNTMALPATNIEANSATANWNNGLTFDADDKSGKLYIFRDGSVDRELIENGGFETGDLTGWNYVNVGGLYACDAYNVVNTNGHSGSYALHVTEEGSGYAGFAYSTVIYQNPMTLYPGTYVMTSWVKMTSADCSGYSDKKAYFVQGLVGHQLQGSTNETCFAISSTSTNRTRNNTYTTVTSNGTYVQLVDTFVLSKTIKALPIVGERCDYGYDFRKFYLDDVTMTRISAPISEDYDKLIEIADLSAASSTPLTGLSGNTQYSYMIHDANGCSSNVITFKTLQSGEPSIEAEGIELSASQDKTATGVIVVTALDAYAPITITKCLDSKISLNTNTLPAEGGAIRVTFTPGATPAGTSGTCELSLITTGMSNPVAVNVLWTVTAGEDVNTPKVDVTEVWTDSLTIEHNVGMDEVDSVFIQFSREKTEEEIVKNVGDEIFFSKYYEAYSHKKLWAIFNPTNDTISLAGMEVWRSKSDGTWNTSDALDLSDAGFYEQGWIYPQEEIVVYTADQVGGCEQRHVDMSTWYAGAHADLALSFSGDDALLLVRNTADESSERHNQLPTISAKDESLISWPDAITERGEEWHMLDIIGAHNGSYNPTSEACTNWDWYNSKTKVNESGDDKGWVGYGSDMDNKKDYNDGKGHEGYLLSTNRCLLVRNKSVTSGANALATNINDMFTLNTEWQGSHVPTSTPGMTQDSVSCINFSYVGGYNYSGYYNSWTEMDDYEVAAEPNPDGSWTVEVDVPTYSCKMFHIEAVKMDTINGVVSPNVVTSVDYKVPIVVDANNVTTAELFNFGGDTCATCDVVVRDEATLSHVEGGKSQFRELIVYPGAKFDNSSKKNFLLDRITVQSKNTEVGYAIINDNGSTIAAGEVRHVKRVDDQHWYSFSLPYDCKISSIQQQNGKSMGEYGEDWVIDYYDGAQRQADKADEHIGESSQYWIDMPSDGVLEANKAYIIGLYTTEWPGQVKNVYFPPFVASGHNAYTESGDDAKTANIYNWTAGVADNPARNHGWNFVGSPYISKFNETTDGQGLNNGSLIMKGKMNEAGEITEDLDHVYISVPADADMMTYNQVLASSQKILPFTGYFVQAVDPTSGSNETLELEYAKGNRTLDTPERRATATRQRVLVELNVIAPNGDKDNTGIWVDDRYTVNYEIGRDLMKIYGEAGRPQLYSRAADNIAMAYIALPDDNAEYIPLELYAPKAGKYTLKIDDNTSMTAGAQTIELLYNNATVADLFFDTYDIEATKAGTIKGYAVRIRRWAQVITSDEQIGGQNITIVANDGQMSVTNLPANAMVSLYDVLGHLMATGYAVDGVVNFHAPATGVYNIVVESAVGHATIKTVIK